MRSLLRITIIVSCTLLMAVSPTPASVQVQAQTELTPLLEMMAYIPASAADWVIGFVDYRAAIETRSGAPDIRNLDDWVALKIGSEDFLHFLFANAAGGQQCMNVNDARLFARDAYAATGIDFYTAGQCIEFGSVPQQGVILNGMFDVEQVVLAHSARGYQIQAGTPNGEAYLCPMAGCEKGNMLRVEAINKSPFGGGLGRQELLYVSPTTIFNSPNQSVLQPMIDLWTGTSSSSLETEPFYEAVTKALAQEARLIHVEFIPLSAENIRHLIEARTGSKADTVADWSVFAGYPFVTYANAATQDRELALIALPFDNADQADIAAAELSKRLYSYTLLTEDKPLTVAIEELGGTIEQSKVIESDDVYVLVIPFSGALETTPTKPQGQLHKLISKWFWDGDAGWLDADPSDS